MSRRWPGGRIRSKQWLSPGLNHRRPGFADDVTQQRAECIHIPGRGRAERALRCREGRGAALVGERAHGVDDDHLTPADDDIGWRYIAVRDALAVHRREGA